MDEQIAIYRDQINEAMRNSVNIVADGRDMSSGGCKRNWQTEELILQSRRRTTV